MNYRKLNAIITVILGDDNQLLVDKRIAYKSINAAKRANRLTKHRIWEGKLPPQSKGCVNEYVA